MQCRHLYGKEEGLERLLLNENIIFGLTLHPVAVLSGVRSTLVVGLRDEEGRAIGLLSSSVQTEVSSCQD